VAVAPLFVATKALLLEKLRLSGVPAASDAADIIDQAIEEVRLGFYDRLGDARVTQLLTFLYVENPTTANARMRSRANACEIAWCRRLLRERLPVMFMDGSANINQVWNDEAAFRRAEQSVFDKLQAEVEAMLLILAGTETEISKVKAAILEPDTPADPPGASIFPHRRTSFGGEFPTWAGQIPDGVY
jgi:hypothetical protein